MNQVSRDDDAIELVPPVLGERMRRSATRARRNRRHREMRRARRTDTAERRAFFAP